MERDKCTAEKYIKKEINCNADAGKKNNFSQPFRQGADDELQKEMLTNMKGYWSTFLRYTKTYYSVGLFSWCNG